MMEDRTKHEGDREMKSHTVDELLTMFSRFSAVVYEAGTHKLPPNPDAEIAFTTALREVFATVEGLRKEMKESEDANDALQQKLESLAPHGTCGCSYDQPNDVCMHHSPKLTQAVSQRDAAMRENKELREAVEKAPYRLRGLWICPFCDRQTNQCVGNIEHAPDCIITRLSSGEVAK